MENLEAMLDELTGLEERYLKAGEKTDEIPKEEPNDDLNRTAKDAMMLKMLYNSVENAHALTNLMRSGEAKDLCDPEKLKGFEDSLDGMLEYLGECLDKIDDEDDAEKKDAEAKDDDEKEPEEDDAEVEEPAPPEEIAEPEDLEPENSEGK